MQRTFLNLSKNDFLRSAITAMFVSVVAVQVATITEQLVAVKAERDAALSQLAPTPVEPSPEL